MGAGSQSARQGEESSPEMEELEEVGDLLDCTAS